MAEMRPTAPRYKRPNKPLWRRFRTRRDQALRILRRYGPGQVQFWFIALILGIGAGLATVGVRLAISYLQATIYGADDFSLASHAATLAWWKIILIPVIGGLIVGALLGRFTPDGRVRSVSHVIEGAALNEGRVEQRVGKVSLLASLITLSTGGSTGREGPVVHMAAGLATYVSNYIGAAGVTARDLLGCAVAAAVAASFNAPLAGAIFALEVILRHYAVHAFAPIAIASTAGAVVGRLSFGDVVEFDLARNMELGFYYELPAFMLLGVVCALVAVVLMRAIFWAEDVADHVQNRTSAPLWLRSGVAGLCLGLIALQFPHIIGVGYETTFQALNGQLDFAVAITFMVVKIAAVAITVGGRMGGGVFSPALMVGALCGLGVGLVATSVLPQWSSEVEIYAIAGMAAVAASVLGAPISTTLIAIELTGNWQFTVAVMCAVSLATIISSRLVRHSFFLTQLERRGVRLSEGPQVYTLSTIFAKDIARELERLSPATLEYLQEQLEAGNFVPDSTSLETILPRLESAEKDSIAVAVKRDGTLELVGAVFYSDALKAYSEALARVAKEEHG